MTAGESYEEANAELKLFYVEWANEPALEFDEMLAIPTCDTALPICPLCCDDAAATDSHFLEVCALEQRLVPRLLAQAVELQQMVRDTQLYSHLIVELTSINHLLYVQVYTRTNMYSYFRNWPMRDRIGRLSESALCAAGPGS